MLADEVRQQMLEAMKTGATVEKAILRVALGELQAVEIRSGSALDDEQAAAVLRKLVKSNEESLAAAPKQEQRERLEQEIAVLRKLLPKTLGSEEISTALEEVRDAILKAANDGQATGIAMKHLKAAGAAVEGKHVAQAVRALRS